MVNRTQTRERWSLFWRDRRNGDTVTEIAKKNEITVQAVYKALKSKTSMVESLLLATVKANRIHVYLYEAVEGFLWGYSPAFKTDVYITYSPTMGIQIWYEHEGNCGECDELMECLWILKTEAMERKIEMPGNLTTPTEMALFLFNTIKDKLGWKESDIKNAQKYSPKKKRWENENLSNC